MNGDTSTIRALAGRLRERADEIRDLAADLTTRAASVPWSGLAADAMRAHVALQVAALHRTADLHEGAAEALDVHAAAVDQVVEQVVDLVTAPVDLVKELLP